MTKVKLDADQIEERVSLGQMQGRIDQAGVITIYTHMNEKSWKPVGRWAQGHVCLGLASGRYVLGAPFRIGCYTIRNR